MDEVAKSIERQVRDEMQKLKEQRKEQKKNPKIRLKDLQK